MHARRGCNFMMAIKKIWIGIMIVVATSPINASEKTDFLDIQNDALFSSKSNPLYHVQCTGAQEHNHIDSERLEDGGRKLIYYQKRVRELSLFQKITSSEPSATASTSETDSSKAKRVAVMTLTYEFDPSHPGHILLSNLRCIKDSDEQKALYTHTFINFVLKILRHDTRKELKFWKFFARIPLTTSSYYKDAFTHNGFTLDEDSSTVIPYDPKSHLFSLLRDPSITERPLPPKTLIITVGSNMDITKRYEE